MEPQDNKRCDLTRTDPQPTKSTRTRTYSVEQQVVTMASRNNADNGSNRLMDMGELKQAILHGTYVRPRPTRPRPSNDVNLKKLSPFEAYLRTGFPSSNHPNDQQLAEQAGVGTFLFLCNLPTALFALRLFFRTTDTPTNSRPARMLVTTSK